MASKRTLDHSSCFPAPKKRKGSSCFVSSSSSTQPRWTYHVFLSFSGEDTRKNFTDHLYDALDQAGIHTFRDDKLPRGREISPDLLKSIEGSRISIVVFSRNYASSRWCLDELVKIIECKETIGQLVLPIFYDVDPSDVRYQKWCFGVAFRRHKKRYGDEMEKVEVRRVALSKAGNISGWVLKNVANGHEAELIRQVVEEVSCKLDRTSLYVAKHPIGMESHVEHVSSLLSIGSDDVRMIGIYGMGGIGKTTIAKAVYNHIFFQFEWSCFLADVRECAGQSNGLAQLQERLLFALLGAKNLKVNSVHEGINLIKERLHSKKVLIVLDDMDHSSQLNTLAGNHDWFGPGSRIIITTRDEQLLNLLKVDERYMAKKLNHKESLQLFNSYAFGGTNPLENYAELANGILHYAGGLPLALEVLGSYLFETPLVEWKSALDQLQRIPHEDIHKILKISFDALNQEIKDIFLDIACFFVGMDRDYVITILKCCDFSPEFGIRVLINKCLLRVNRYNVLTMHDLLRDMGREINRQESPKELGKRRRLSFHKDVSFVLENNTGTETVEGVILTGLPMVKKIQWSNKAFAGMHNLRLLQINHVHLSGNFEHLLKELRWLCWHNCPLEYLPSNFHPEKLVILDMQFSKIKTLWKDGEHFRSLKILNLSNSKCLTKSPIFCALSMLEELLLEGCTSLMELHESIGLLDKLVHLNLKDCMNLRYLPGSVSKLKSVERLNLTGCAKLEEFPEHLGDMKSLTDLLADGTAIKQLPFSIRLLKNLRTLGCSRQLTTKSLFSRISSWVSRRRFLPSSVSGLCSLTDLCLSNCNMSERDFPADFGSLSSLRWLDLDRNNFKHLPDCFSHLSKLRLLKLNDCRRLQSISDLPPNLNKVVAYNCASLEKISGLSKLKTLRICLSNDQYGRFLSNGNNDGMEDPPCFQGARIIPFDRLNNLQNFLQHLGGMSRMREVYRTCILNVSCLMSDDFHTGDLGDCFNDYEYSYNFINGRSFSYKITASSSISLEVPVLREEVDEYIAEFNVMIVYYRVGDEESWAMELVDYPSITITNKINGINLTHTPIFFAIPASCGVYTWKICLRVEDYFGYRIKGGDQLDISFTMPSPFKVKRGVMNLQTQCTYCYKVDSMHLLLQKKFNRQRYIHHIKKKNRVACSPLSHHRSPSPHLPSAGSGHGGPRRLLPRFFTSRPLWFRVAEIHLLLLEELRKQNFSAEVHLFNCLSLFKPIEELHQRLPNRSCIVLSLTKSRALWFFYLKCFCQRPVALWRHFWVIFVGFVWQVKILGHDGAVGYTILGSCGYGCCRLFICQMNDMSKRNVS